ncbi:hypothetical protein UA08_00543 [Talaromyces atroroseus]|uniref:Uncharacterized protein n=1 Tax=Talaromyces atroroseus TaxID=1441469 RepID=A0A225ATM0_TALAT|nr:hypothetical protein UA08_00543 [Talaromyces atroroseus]OKL64290.1 hypothetical protein UA08_00543 [Talaromyces atroroseus]
MSAAFAMAPQLHRQALAPVSVRRIRVRALQQTKLGVLNKLNATVPSTPLKRSVSYDSDGENVAPIKLDASKRKRDIEDDGQVSESPKALKTSRISLVTVEKTTPLTPRKVNAVMAKPAGRSPPAKTKLTKAFGRRSQRDSLASNTNVACVKSKPATLSSRKVAQPASWFFNIHADTPDEEATNTMQHFAGRLDISDDECKAKYDDRGKENIPPHELGITMPTAAQPTPVHSRRNMMAQLRSPLGELRASDYYDAGLNALSYAVIHDNENLKTSTEMMNASVVPESTALPKTISLTTCVSEESTKTVDGTTAA